MGCKCISIDKVKVEGRGGMGGWGRGNWMCHVRGWMKKGDMCYLHNYAQCLKYLLFCKDVQCL